MGTFTFRLPDIGEGIAEAEIVAWHVKVGDVVAEDGRVADLMTDKATVEMESPVSGRIVSIAGEVGDVIAIGSPLVVIETEGDEAEPASGPSTGSGRAEVVVEVPVEKPVEAVPIVPEPVSVAVRSENPNPFERPSKVLASPAVRARAEALGIDLAEVKPSEAGRVRHADLDAFLAYNAGGGYRPAGSRHADETIKVIGLRRRIAENMAASKRAIPHFTYVEECDVTALEAMRAQLNDARGAKPKLTMLPLLITAICKTLPDYPMLNARYDDEAGVVTRHGAVHLGMATQTPGGLMVPVIRDAQDRNLWQLAHEIVRLADAARSGTATSGELSGSTITITSLGALGGVATTPVINRPEVAIIGPNRIVERPMFVPDESNRSGGGERIEKRKLMNVSISCDHRVVDGWDAASFVQALKRLIETPVLLLAD
ncbi:dihydrolipoamide acetyltransferase family protein [Novosphingobium sp. PASSN1]|uniref:dihydrolipoamide acetyltransferase family protein n=1 Tax=Novosphingobium sp. PASSN1 TaxID=2015561 RepID=UPI000BDADBED|nr:dihydrolipoamide acetyltransferase family protein [Novosphingobium sp. PASSN1]OYU35301.1 MAG: branched-chain alpha-keto acid dehydrogenase subunit E2 [Novosphingobium sp. PASSN1]